MGKRQDSKWHVIKKKRQRQQCPHAGPMASTLYESSRIFTSSSPENRLWEVQQVPQQVSDGEGLKLSPCVQGLGYQDMDTQNH